MATMAQEIAGDLLLSSGGIFQIESASGGVVFLAKAEGSSALQFNITQWSGTSNGITGNLSFRRARGTAASPAVVAANDWLGDLNFRGWDGTTFFDAGSIRVIAGASAWSSTEHTARMSVFLTGASGTKTEYFRIGHDSLRLGASGTQMNVSLLPTAGVQWGTASQLQGWWGATPAAKPAAVSDAAGGSVIDVEARAAINTLLSRLRTVGLITT